MEKTTLLNKLKEQILLLNKDYTGPQVFLSILTGFIFFVLPASLVITIGVNLIIMYFFYFEMLYSMTFVLLFVLSYFGVVKFVETLKNYKILDQIDYLFIKNKLVIFNIIVLTFISLIGLLILFSI